MTVIGIRIFPDSFHQAERILRPGASLERPAIGGHDGRAVGQGIGEGNLDFKQVGPVSSQDEGQVETAVRVRVSGHEMSHQESGTGCFE